tara:strand:- start:11690 stop:12064 length:375 start_codon:yes stop_codon:yes gene_type:complete
MAITVSVSAHADVPRYDPPDLSEGKTLCPINENIPAELMIPEESYSKEQALAALESLATLIEDNDFVMEIDGQIIPDGEVYSLGYSRFMSRVDGYVLRQRAMTGSPYDIEQFCEFMKANAMAND